MIDQKLFKTFYLFIFTILGLFLIYSYTQRQNTNPSIINSQYKKENLIDYKNTPLIKNTKITGKFYSKFDNLGTLAFRFNTQARINEDVVEFRIKEENTQEWYYQNKYNTNQFQPGELFPFGFPIITDSKNKTYLFEIESLAGEDQNSVIVDIKNSAIFIAKHQFPLNKLGVIEWIKYLPIKTINLFADKNFIFYFVAYFSPIFLFISHQASKKSKGFLGVLLIAMFFDVIFTPQYHSDFYTLTIFIYWLYYAYKHKLKSEITISIIIILLILDGFLINNLNALQAEKASIWIYLLFINTIFQKIIFFVKKRHLNIGLNEVVCSPIKKVIKFSREVLDNQDIHLKVIGIKIAGRRLKRIIFIIFQTSLIIFLIHTFHQKIKFTLSQIELYKLFFPKTVIKTFFFDVGFYLILIYLLSIAIFIFIIIHFKSLSLKLILLTLFSLSVFKVNNYLLETSTSQFSSDIIINSVNPSKATLWDEVIIKGTNFKGLPFAGKVLIDDQEQHILVWDENKIIFITDPTKTKSGKLKVVDHKNNESDEIDFEYYDFNTKKTIY